MKSDLLSFHRSACLCIAVLLCFFVEAAQGVSAEKRLRTSVSQRNGIYELRLDDVVLCVDAARGARIVSFRKGKQEILSPAEVHPENYGSTLWLSPQTWKWPPYPVLDCQPYQVRMAEKEICFVSEPDSASGCRFSKSFSVDRKKRSFVITYVITNISEREKSLAPWEVTRVKAGGISFFPLGEAGGFSKSNMTTAEINGMNWFTYRPAKITDHQKMFRSGSEGWLAHANNNLLFIKQFPDIRVGEEAPHEAEVELYANKDRTYIELEIQGAYQTLRPGASVSWIVEWFLREIPSSVAVEEGNPRLADYVRTIVNRK